MESSNPTPQTKNEEVPENLFSHVERSLDSGIKKEMLLEVRYKINPDTYWIGSITMVCGPLLRVRYIGSNSDFWCDITKTVVHPLGWCSHFDEIVDPPEGISKGDDIVNLMTSMVAVGTSVPNESIVGNGLTPIDRMKPGMKVEVQNGKDPYIFWIATIVENVGGRLLLHYDAPEDVYEDFWLFYTDNRLHRVGFSESKGLPYKLNFPDNSQNVTFSESQWEACYKSALKKAKEKPFPSELINNDTKPHFHKFEVGMKLEALNPSNMSDICPATITKVFDSFYFLVVLDDYLNDCNNDGGFWLCTMAHPYIFPVGWSDANKIQIQPPMSWDKKKEFDWGEYLQIHSSLSAPAKYFRKTTDSIALGFQEGMKLEVVNPLNSGNICSSHIMNITKHLLQIRIESSKKSHWFNYESLDIFPCGWCDSNDFPLESLDSLMQNTNQILSRRNMDRNQPNNKDEWCDKIFFNYKCYSGPFISKNKLSQLPKNVGPGPLQLVIREVLNMIISVAYKPAKLLKDWEQDEKTETGQTLELLKAKLKTSTYHATVQVVSKKNEVPAFCKEICNKLQACPYLFGPMEISDQCPERCLQVDKTKFHNIMDRRGRPKGSSSKGVPKCWANNKKRKNKKGLHFMTVRALEKRAALESGTLPKDGVDSANESDPSPSSTPQQSESGTRPNSPDSNSDTTNKKQRKKREPRTNFPPLEMKTRGAKLPNFAIQIKEGHWNKKDVQTIYNNTCVVPRKNFDDYSESEGDSSMSNSLDIGNNEDREISDVSDSEEPELKKLRVTPQQDPSPTDSKIFNSNSSKQLSPNPCEWSTLDLYDYLKKYNECRDIAEKIKEEEIDGTAFILLNFPTMREHLNMKMEPALNLCKHVALLKWSYLSRFSSIKCDG